MINFKPPRLIVVDGEDNVHKRRYIRALAEAIGKRPKVRVEVLHLTDPLYKDAFSPEEHDEAVGQFGHTNLEMFKYLGEKYGMKYDEMERFSASANSTMFYRPFKEFVIVNRDMCTTLDYNKLNSKEGDIYAGIYGTETKITETYNYGFLTVYLAVKTKPIDSFDHKIHHSLDGFNNIINNADVCLFTEHFDKKYSVCLVVIQDLYLEGTGQHSKIVRGVLG